MSDLLFTICVPVRDDADNLRRCLSGFRSQDLTDCEIIVCDDGSSAPLVASDFDDTGVPFTLISQAGQGPSAARNHIARLALGRYLFFVDADTIPRFDMLERARGIVRKHPEFEAFYGSYDDEPAHVSLVSWYRNLLHHYTHQRSARRGESVSTFWCGCGVILRELYLEMGGLSEFYDKPSIEDIELGARLSARGVQIAICPELQVKHLKRWTVGSWLYTDLFRRGIPWVRLMRTTKAWASQLNFSWSQRLASLTAVALVLSVALTLVVPSCALAALVSLALFLLLNRGFIGLARRKGGVAASIAVIPLHVVYNLVCVTAVGAALLYPHLQLPLAEKLEPLPRP